jgi:hypothetical protein
VIRPSRALGPVLVVMATACIVASAHAQTPPVPTLDYSLIDRATVRVISVVGVGTVRVGSQSRRDRMLAVPEAGHGSGIMVSADGLVVTARHVVEGSRLVAVWVPGEAHAYQATVVYQDPTVDFAIVAVQGTFASFVPLAPTDRTLHVREQVHAIGYPLDARREDPQSAQGIISGVLPDGTLQLDIALNPGNSGGPLIDASEQVLGIVVARGAVEEGVQGIGVAVPTAPILAALGSEVPARLAAARARLTDAEHGAQVAELVRLLVRVGGAELIHEVVEEMEGHGRSEMLGWLRALEAETSDPDIHALVAAYYWDAAAVVLERAGGLMRAAEMAAGPDRDLVVELMTRAVRLAYRASETDPEILRRSPFVRRLVYYFERPAVAGPVALPVEPDAPFVAPVVASPQAVDAEVAVSPPTPPRPPDPYHDHRLRLGGFLALVNHAEHEGIGGAIVTGRLAWSPITARVGVFAFDPIVALELGLGGWDSFVALVSAEIGGMFRFGDRFAAVVGATWVPGLIIARSQTEFSFAGWHAFVGGQIDDILITAGWRGYGRANDYSLHQYEIALEWGFE